MNKNPFKSRWAVDDPEFIKLRKKQWPFVKGFLSLYSAKEMKNIRQFFVEGDWLDGLLPDITCFIAWTPTKNTEELIELLIFLSKRVRGDDNISLVQYTAAFGGWSISTDSPVSFAFGNEELLAKVIIGETYSDRIELTPQVSIVRNFSAQKFIEKYEDYILRFLVNDNPNFYSPVKYCLNYYLSCIHYLEDKGEVVEHHESFAHIISRSFNFVEGGQTDDKPPSSVAEFAQLFKERVTRTDAPESIKAMIQSLEPDYLIEVERQSLINTKIYVFNYKIKQSHAFGAPFAKAMRGCEHSDAIKVFWKAAINSHLIDKDADLPELFQVNVNSLLSEGVIKELGYKLDEPVPAYRLTTWYQPSIKIDSHGKGKFGVDLILILPKNSVISDDMTTIIYYPRLNSHYKNLFPSSVLYLKERQIRRSMWEFTHKHLLDFNDEDWCNKLVNSFMDSADLNIGFDLFKNSSEGNNEYSISGPDTPPWEGEPLPELNLDEVLQHVR